MTLPEVAFAHLHPHLDGPIEQFVLVCCDRLHHAKHTYVLARGDPWRVTVDLAQVERVLRHHQPPAIIVAHNHPAGTPNPSRCDIEFTLALDALCTSLGVRLLDHYIVTATTAQGIRALAQKGT